MPTVDPRAFVDPGKVNDPSQRLLDQLGRAESDLRYQLDVIKGNQARGHLTEGQALVAVDEAWARYHQHAQALIDADSKQEETD
ncbi:MAG TPA: hypothetical protein VN695_01150 [Streptosporangiaceae bacterium]|nr:hypothetical protein [Streptosporangiaceae bacterium]